MVDQTVTLINTWATFPTPARPGSVSSLEVHAVDFKRPNWVKGISVWLQIVLFQLVILFTLIPLNPLLTCKKEIVKIIFLHYYEDYKTKMCTKCHWHKTWYFKKTFVSFLCWPKKVVGGKPFFISHEDLTRILICGPCISKLEMMCFWELRALRAAAVWSCEVL